jgi:hypothetical protein
LELYYNDAGKAYCLLEGLTRTQYGGTTPPSTFPAGRSTGSRPYFDPRPSPVALPGLDLVLRDLGGGGGPGERGDVVMLVFGEPVGGSTAATQTR